MRDGQNIYSRHFVSLADALLGKEFDVHTVHSPRTLSLEAAELLHQIEHLALSKEFAEHGIPDDSQESHGSHFAEVHLEVPTNLTP